MSITIVALWLATKHALAAGVQEPWQWAANQHGEFLAEADDPAIVEQVRREMEHQDGRDAGLEVIGRLLVGPPPPPPEASVEEHFAYTEAVLRAMRGENLTGP